MFQEEIKNFLGLNNLDNVGIYMIHLERITERLENVRKLEKDLGLTFNKFWGIDGRKLVENGCPTKDNLNPTMNRIPGSIGCSVSHIEVCKDAYKNGYNYAIIFEDDAILNNKELFYDYLRKCKEYFDSSETSWDIFYMGSTNLEFSEINKYIARIYFSFGLHSYIINKNMMLKIIERFNNNYNLGYIERSDWLTSNILKSSLVEGYGINLGEFEQPFTIDRKYETTCRPDF
jgi:GR25 family glycosyltransferase involved in LPS biosynthesis